MLAQSIAGSVGTILAVVMVRVAVVLPAALEAVTV
jgi:hypothetical protein